MGRGICRRAVLFCGGRRSAAPRGGPRLPTRAPAAPARRRIVQRKPRQQTVQLVGIEPQQYSRRPRLLWGYVLAKGQKLLQALVLKQYNGRLSIQ